MKQRLIGLPLGVALAFAVASAGAIADDPSSGASLPAGKNCVVYLEQTGPSNANGVVETTPVDRGCYPTFKEAIEVASGGDVMLPSGAGPSEVTEGMLEEPSTSADRVTISVHWRQVAYDGERLIYSASPCSEAKGIAYADPRLGDDWNDAISSAAGYNGCNRVSHFEHIYYNGAKKVCSPQCDYMGALNNESSSLRWRNE